MSVMIAIDTSGKDLHLAVDGPLGSQGATEAAQGKRHSEVLLNTLDRLLADCGYEKTQITAVVVCVGPGGYTSTRVGMVTAKALGLALGAKLWPVPASEQPWTTQSLIETARRVMQSQPSVPGHGLEPAYPRPLDAKLPSKPLRLE